MQIADNPRNGKRIHRAPTRQPAVTPGVGGGNLRWRSSAETEEKQPEQRGYQSNLTGFSPNEVGICSTFLTYPPFVTPPVMWTRCDGASKRSRSARLSHCFLIGKHLEESAQENDIG